MTSKTNSVRSRIAMSDREIIEHLARFGYRVLFEQLAFTTETVDDFRQARKQWHRAGSARINEPGLLIIEDAQPRPYQKTRDVAIVSLGNARVVMGVEPKKDVAEDASKAISKIRTKTVSKTTPKVVPKAAPSVEPKAAIPDELRRYAQSME